MKILHLLSGGGIGGIEILCRDIAQISNEQHEFCFLYSGGPIAEEMQQDRISAHFLYTESLPGRISSLIRLVKEKSYDIVIIHHEGTGIYLFYLILTFYFNKIKFIKYLHCSFEEKYFYQGNRFKDWLNYHVLKLSLERSDRLIAVSEFVKRTYGEEFTVRDEKCSVIYNGIRIPEDKKFSYGMLTADQPVNLLYIGRLVEVKGIRVLLKAMKRLKDMDENFQLDILGDGPKRAEYEQLVQKLQMGDSIRFHGQILQKEIFYDRTNIFVYPSVWQEAFGISIVEAMAHKKLCVASHSGGIPEIISDDEDGFLFETANVDSLVQTLRKARAVCCSEKYDKMVLDARKKAMQFDIFKMVERLEALCKMELEKK